MHERQPMFVQQLRCRRMRDLRGRRSSVRHRRRLLHREVRRDVQGSVHGVELLGLGGRVYALLWRRVQLLRHM